VLINTHARQWGMLVLLSVAFSTVLVATGLGAGVLIGTMIAAVLMGIRGAAIEVSNPVFCLAQGLMGCMIASTLEANVVQNIGSHLWPMVATVTLTMVAATLTGMALARFESLPGSTGVWGVMPGAASAMAVICADFGGDPRIVALMQYTRVVIVVLSTSAVSHLMLQSGEVLAPAGASEPAAWFPVLQTVLVAAAGAAIGRWLRIPAGTLFVPLILGGALKLGGLVDLHVPHWLSILAYTAMGWSIGLKFRRHLLFPLLRAMPVIVAGIVALIVLCALSGWLLVAMAGVSPMTAYLATSPGGLDSVSVLALSVKADMSFVVAFQTLRLFVVIMVGPVVGRGLARFTPA
jgi:membrane AbrB-like protein